MKNSSKIIVLSLLLIVIMATLSSCEVGGMTIKIPGWEAFREKFGPHEHSMKLVAEVPATCYFEGTEAHYSCEKCNQLFADEAGNSPIQAPRAIPKIAHTEEKIAGKEPTCSETGLTEGIKCSVCNDILKAQSVISCKEHTEETVAEVPAGCANNGLSEGKKCSVCGAITLAQHIVYATGHQYDNDQDLNCNVCGNFRCLHKNSEEFGEAKQPTCKEEGLALGEKCSDCGFVLVEQKPIEKLAHTEATDAAVAPTCTETGLTAGKHCSVCGEVIEAQETVDALGHTYDGDQDSYCNVCGDPRCFHNNTEAVGEAKESTCTEEGLTAGKKCSDCGEIIEEQKPIEKAEHSLGKWSVTTAPTYSAAGQIQASCENCTHVSTVDIPAVSAENGYTLVTEGETSVWEYTYDGEKITVSVVSEPESEKYSFVAGTESDPFTAANGGSTTSTRKTEEGVGTYYGNGTNKTFTYTLNVNVEKDATVTLIMRFAKRNGSYTYDQIFGSLTVNGSTDGITYTEDSTYAWEDKKAEWGNFQDYALATVSLTEGTNEIEFTIITSCNLEAVIIESTVPVSLNKTDDSQGEDEPLQKEEYTFAVIDETNPFTSVVDNDGNTNDVTAINTNKYGTFYEHTKSATFTLTINAEKATDVSFIVKVCSTNGYSFDYAKAITSVTSKSSSGASNNVVINSGTVDTVGWYTETASSIEIATISLAQGVNTITFTMGTETAKDLNIASVVFESLVEISLTNN